MDRIHIRDLTLACIIGLYERERENKQNVVINITLHADLREAGLTDDVEKTVDYKSVKQGIIALVEDSRFLLVEALAEAIARKCLEFDRVEQVDVLVEKPGALKFARTVGVEITRLQNDECGMQNEGTY
ncbi:MAG: dihydroneopterin aldolase [Armatimonadetes bacterium]|nr:dihydroneopterin aldolase [Armatimonadota bacterium]